MRKLLLHSFLILSLIAPLGAADVVVSSQTLDGVCQDAGCVSSTTIKPAWQTDLEKTDKSWDACRQDVDTFCEGIQVGSDRLNECLKEHRVKLSPECRKAQGL